VIAGQLAVDHRSTIARTLAVRYELTLPSRPDTSGGVQDLFGNTRFETAVQRRYLIGALVQFADQPRVLHCDHRLRREILQQRDGFVGERADFPAVNAQCAEQHFISAERDGQRASEPADLGRLAGSWDSPENIDLPHVGNVDQALAPLSSSCQCGD
jgi:hypothetical protein